MKIMKQKNKNGRYGQIEVKSGDIGSARIIHKDVWKRFFHTCKVANIPYFALFIYIALSIVHITFSVYIPQVNADFFNGDASAKSIAKFFGCELLITAIVQVVLYANQIFRAKTNRNLRNVLWGKILKVKPRFYDKVSSNTLLSRITIDTESFNAFILDILWQIIMSVYTLVLTLKEMSDISLKASFVLLIFVPISFLMSFIMGRLNIKYENAVKFKMSNLTDYLSELVSCLPIIKSFNRQHYETERGKKVIDEYFTAQRNLIFLDVGKQFASIFVGILPEIAIIMMGVRLLSSNSIDAAGWYVFYIYAGTLFSFAAELGGYWQSTKSIQGQLATVTQVLLEEEEGIDRYVSDIIESGDIAFDGVSFAYDEKTYVLNNVSFTIAKNKTTAIVGYSGSGKSTVIKLLERIYESSKGRILLGGKELKEYGLSGWRDKIAVVSQNSPMISGTIKDNILYGIKREVSDEEIMAAANLAYIGNFIRKCPDGLNQPVGQFGSKLSGGQRQKISIVRAILSEPEILILDEPTASLDILSINEVAEIVNSLHGKITIIIAAHQPRLVKSADSVIVINSDHTAVQGTHSTLLATDEFYKKLINNDLEVSEDEE